MPVIAILATGRLDACRTASYPGFPVFVSSQLLKGLEQPSTPTDEGFIVTPNGEGNKQSATLAASVQ
jgi:hypothetical protein